MSSYKDLQEQIAELQARAEEERLAAIVDVKQKIEDYELSLEDLDLLPPQHPYAENKIQQPLTVKYQNSPTGRRGRPPKWPEK